MWQSGDCRKADLVHKRLLLSVSSLRVAETGLKDRAGAVLHPVNLHLCVLCSVLCSITQHMLVTRHTQLAFSPSCTEKGSISIEWEAGGHKDHQE